MVSCADVTTVAYSDRASGVYVSTEMFGKLGITEAMKDKAKKNFSDARGRDRQERHGSDRCGDYEPAAWNRAAVLQPILRDGHFAASSG
jgi:hypothetical protein